MRIDTNNGLTGVMVEYRAFSRYEPEMGGVAIVLRDKVPFANRPYSVHTIFSDENGLWASNGRYDLTLTEAVALLVRRVAA